MNDRPCFFNGGHLICPPGWERKKHSHSFYQLLLIYTGEIEAEFESGKIKAGPGDVLFYDVDIPHREWNCAESPLEMIYLDWEGPDPELPSLIKDSRGRARILAEWLLNDFKTSVYSNIDETVDSLIHALLLETQKNANPESDVFINKVRTLIVENLREPLTLESLADFLQMNKYTFLRKYKSHAGHTPMDEVRRIRLEKARDLIISTDLPLKDVAEKCGLSNEQHLSRIFTRYLKVPPGYFRKNH